MPFYSLRGQDLIYAWRSHRQPQPTEMIIVGSIQDKSSPPLLEGQAIHFGMQPQQVIVQVSDRAGIRVGQKLYVIEKHSLHQKFRDGLIIGELQVRSLYQSPLYGWALTAVGFLDNVRKGHYVARIHRDREEQQAHLLKRRGDHYVAKGKLEEAIALYGRAQSLDKQMPEIYAALGDLYYRLNRQRYRLGEPLPLEALEQYRRAWQQRHRFRYRYDEFQYYQRYMQLLYEAYTLRRLEAARESRIVSYLDRILEVGEQARRIRPADAAVLLGLGRAHYYRLRYLHSLPGAAARQRYDRSLDEAGKLLKKSLEQGDRSSELYRIAILYYGDRYRSLRSDLAEDRSQRQEIRSLILEQLAPYYATYLGQQGEQRDPEVDRILKSLQ